MKKSTGYLLTMSFAFIALASSVSFCSHAAPTTTYDVTVIEKQAPFTVVVAPEFIQGDNGIMSYEFNLCVWEVRGAEPLFQPVKAKGLISAYFESYGKRYWLIPFKITPGSKLYEYFADVGKTHYIQSTGLIEKPVKIPSKC